MLGLWLWLGGGHTILCDSGFVLGAESYSQHWLMFYSAFACYFLTVTILRDQRHWQTCALPSAILVELVVVSKTQKISDLSCMCLFG